MVQTQKMFKKSLKFAGLILVLWIFTLSSTLFFSREETIASSAVPTTIIFPEGFSATPESFDGGEILYHLNISGVNQKVRGYFQIISTGTDFEEYLETAEQYKAADIDTFRAYQGDRPGSVIWEYTTPKSNVRTFFIKKEQRLYVLTLSADKDKVAMSELTEYFNEVLNGLVI